VLKVRAFGFFGSGDAKSTGKLNDSKAADPHKYVTCQRHIWSKAKRVLDKAAKSGGTRTPIPAQGGQQSGDCGQQVMAA
jgi:hypothetical protein